MDISIQAEPNRVKRGGNVELGATLLHTATGIHPVQRIRNVDWNDTGSNRSARLQGFPRLAALLELKQRNVDLVESNDSGFGPDGRGWAAKWRLFPERWDPDQKFTLQDLTHHLNQCQPKSSHRGYGVSSSVSDYGSLGRATGFSSARSSASRTNHQPEYTLATSSLQYDGVLQGNLTLNPPAYIAPIHRQATKPALFDVVLISRLPQGIKTQALRHMPLTEIMAKPSFCFLQVEHPSEVEFCCEILEGWGFRLAEDIVSYDDKMFRAGSSVGETCLDKASGPTQGIQSDHEEYKRDFGELSRAEALSDLSLSQHDYNSIVPYELSIGNKSDFVHPRPMYGYPDKFTSAKPLPNVFTRTAHHCLMGVKGTVRR